MGVFATARQLVRLARHAAANPVIDLRRAIRRALLAPLMPATARASLDGALDALGLVRAAPAVAGDRKRSSLQARRHSSSKPPMSPQAVAAQEASRIPHVPDFKPNPAHEAALADMEDDWGAGEHLLLIGNQVHLSFFSSSFSCTLLLSPISCPPILHLATMVHATAQRAHTTPALQHLVHPMSLISG
jgi:hypothetical protein